MDSFWKVVLKLKFSDQNGYDFFKNLKLPNVQSAKSTEKVSVFNMRVFIVSFFRKKNILYLTNEMKKKKIDNFFEIYS